MQPVRRPVEWELNGHTSHKPEEGLNP